MARPSVHFVKCNPELHTVTVSWIIENFVSIPIDSIYGSPYFFPLSNRSRGWCFTLKKSHRSINLRLNQDSNHQVVHMYHFLLIADKNGAEYWRSSSMHTYKNKTFYNLTEELEWNDRVLQMRTDNLDKLPGGTLIIVCTLRSLVFGVSVNKRISSWNVHEFDEFPNVCRDLKTICFDPKYADFTLKVGDTLLPVHKLILRCRSRVFARMFEHENDIVEIEDIELEVLKSLILYIYSEVVDNHDVLFVRALYYAADKYEILDLRNKCTDILFSRMSIDNVCKSLILAIRHSDWELKRVCCSFISTFHEQILTTPEWKQVEDLEPELSKQVKENDFWCVRNGNIIGRSNYQERKILRYLH